MRRESYVLAAFSIYKRRAIQYSESVTVAGLAQGVKTAMERGADYVSLRRIRPEAEAEGR
jgi:hypothetical protein